MLNLSMPDKQSFVLGCLGGVATSAVVGAMIGAVMGLGIYDFLKREQDVREVDRLFMKGAARNTMHAARLPFAGANGFGANRQRFESRQWAFEEDPSYLASGHRVNDMASGANVTSGSTARGTGFSCRRTRCCTDGDSAAEEVCPP